jgi:hypothetical protein
LFVVSVGIARCSTAMRSYKYFLMKQDRLAYSSVQNQKLHRSLRLRPFWQVLLEHMQTKKYQSKTRHFIAHGLSKCLRVMLGFRNLFNQPLPEGTSKRHER